MAEIGLFPLGVVLLPTERVPLHIFEPRYRELIEECLETDGDFGFVYADDDGIREIGTRARVTDVLERFDDGRLNVLVEGGERFRVESLTRGRSFMTAEVVDVDDDASEAGEELTARAIGSFRALAALAGAEAPRSGRVVAAALVRARRAGRACRGSEAAAARVDAARRSGSTSSPSCSTTRASRSCRASSSASARSATARRGAQPPQRGS